MSQHPRVSVCIATYNKVRILSKVLRSIRERNPVLNYEIIVIDDGTEGFHTSLIPELSAPNVIFKTTRHNSYRNPSFARNIAMRLATAPILILQSDDVVHMTDNSLSLLSDFLPKTFNISTVYDYYSDSGVLGAQFTGVNNPRPLFFLGSVYRQDMFAIGGNSEEFTEPGYEDNWLGCCLEQGRGLVPNFRLDVLGYHISHARPANVYDCYPRMEAVFNRKCSDAITGQGTWTGTDAPWPE